MAASTFGNTKLDFWLRLPYYQWHFLRNGQLPQHQTRANHLVFAIGQRDSRETQPWHTTRLTTIACRVQACPTRLSPIYCRSSNHFNGSIFENHGKKYGPTHPRTRRGTDWYSSRTKGYPDNVRVNFTICRKNSCVLNWWCPEMHGGDA